MQHANKNKQVNSKEK